MFSWSYKVASPFGIPVRLHISLLAIVLFLVHKIGWFHGILLELGLVASLVAHELGHSLVAIRKGCRVREITLLCIGGVAQMERIPTRPRDEFLMAIAGPAVSLALGSALIPLGSYLAKFSETFDLLYVLGWVNLGLVAMNLIPAFPMDGGRVLRSALTPKFGRLRATAIAARLGQIVAILMVLRGWVVHNWILVFIGVFVFWAAGKEYALVRLQEFQKRMFGWSWVGGDEPPDDDETVLIGPPPYDPSSVSRSTIRPEREKNPFGFE